jgi:hypothetical protein
MRVFEQVPDIAFHKAIQQYGFSIGRPVFTWKQQRIALLNYTFFAITRN